MYVVAPGELKAEKKYLRKKDPVDASAQARNSKFDTT